MTGHGGATARPGVRGGGPRTTSPGASSAGRRLPLGLSARLLTSQVLVLASAVLTAWLVAAVVGPAIFHDHLSRTSVHGDPQEATLHAEEAFRDASLISLGVALVTALVVASAVSAYITRRISRPVEDLARAASAVAAGDYDVDVPDPRLGREFGSLAGSFTTMAAQLHGVEGTRRRLLSDLAHEMRTPLATVDAYLEAMQDGVATADTPTLAMLRTQTRRLSRLADDVSAVSRVEDHQVELDLVRQTPGDLVRGAVEVAAARFAAAGVAIDAEVVGRPSDVMVDPERMAQVLGNLVDNALRHTDRGGQVRVMARPGPDAGEVSIDVSDTGDGIPADALPHLFERFYRADTARDRERGGSGIGLAIVKALVRAHGGRVSAVSPGPGQGSTFTIILPAAPTSRRQST